MKRRRKLILILLIPVVAIIAWLGLEDGYAHWHISAICPKCLQHAHIQKHTLYGLTIWKSTRLNQNPGGLMSSAAFSPEIPQISPDLYRQIFDQPCDHEFKEGGFGRTRGLFLAKIHADGMGGVWRLFAQRIEAIDALYNAFILTGDQALARKTYVLIDETFPLNNDDHMYQAMEFYRESRNRSVEQLALVHPETAKTVKTMIAFESIIPQLKRIQTSEEWATLLSDITNRSL